MGFACGVFWKQARIGPRIDKCSKLLFLLPVLERYCHNRTKSEFVIGKNIAHGRILRTQTLVRNFQKISPVDLTAVQEVKRLDKKKGKVRMTLFFSKVSRFFGGVGRGKDGLMVV